MQFLAAISNPYFKPFKPPIIFFVQTLFVINFNINDNYYNIYEVNQISTQVLCPSGYESVCLHQISVTWQYSSECFSSTTTPHSPPKVGSFRGNLGTIYQYITSENIVFFSPIGTTSMKSRTYRITFLRPSPINREPPYWPGQCSFQELFL